MTPQLDGWVYTVGWALVHFVWQGTLIGVATAALLAVCRRASSDVRYAVACVGLAALLAAPLATMAVLRAQPVFPALSVSIAPAESDSARILATFAPREAQPATSVVERTSAALEASLPTVVWMWLAGVTLLLIRFAVGSWRVRRLRAAVLGQSVSSWQSKGEQLARRLRVSAPFRIIETPLVDVPSVVGAIRPVLLLPVSALSGLAPGQIEALIAHELAHVRRYDYAVNIFQTMAEALLFFHPAVWWISSRIREEREHCCDDIAVEICGEPAAYASALAELAALRRQHLALSIGAAHGRLLTRVRRILRVPEVDAPGSATRPLAVSLALLLIVGVAVQSAAQKPAAAGQSTPDKLVTVTTQTFTETFALRTTDHFHLMFPPELDLHADRLARDAEAAYARVSEDLRHNVAFSIPLVLLRSSSDFERLGHAADRSPLTAATERSGDHILFAADKPVDQWQGLIVHEVAHVFGFDILPSKSTPVWVREGFAEYERGTWDPNDLAAVRESVRSNNMPAMSRLQGAEGGSPQVVAGFGHAAFDFIESRAGKAGIRQFLFELRKAGDGGADPFTPALQMDREAFDRAFEAYLRQRFTAAPSQSAPAKASLDAALRVEGDVTAIRKGATEGLACIELWVPVGDGIRRQRWAVECSADERDTLLDALKPGDRVVVTGPLAHGFTDQRVTLEVLTRPADGFTWPARQPRPIPAASPRH